MPQLVGSKIQYKLQFPVRFSQVIILRSITSVYNIQTFNNTNQQVLRERHSDINVKIIFQADWEQKANKILQKL